MAELSIRKPLQAGVGQLVNYAFADVVRNTGYLTYYLAGLASGAISTHSPETTHGISEYLYTIQELCSESTTFRLYTSTISRNFGTDTYKTSGSLIIIGEIPFNRAINLKGKAYLQIPIVINDKSPVSDFIVSGALYHYNGITETFLGDDRSNQASGATGAYVNLLEIDINKHFKEGESLLVKQELYRVNNTQSSSGAIIHDPSNRALTIMGSTTSTAQNIINIPIKVSI